MAKIKKLNINNEVFYPLTHVNAVVDNSGKRVNELLSGKVDKSSIAQTTGDSVEKVMSQKAASGEFIKNELSSVQLGAGKNIFDKSSITSGFINAYGKLKPNDAYCVSGYIEVKSNQNYFLSYSAGYPGAPNTYCAFYDESFDFIESVNVSSFVTPENCAYLRFTMYVSRLDSTMLEEGNSRTIYEPYNPISQYINDVARKIELENEITKVDSLYTRISSGKNIFDPNKVTVGFYIHSDGRIVSNNAYSISDFIHVEENEVYFLSSSGNVYPGTEDTFCAFYDEKFNFLSAVNTSEFTTPQGCCYLRFSFANSRTDTMLEKGDHRTEYEAYNPIKTYIEADLAEIDSRLDKSEEEVKTINGKLGNEAKNEVIHLESGAYSSKDLQLFAGQIITDLGGYDGELLLSSTKPFDTSNYKRVSNSSIPYTVVEDVLVYRSTKPIDTDITVHTPVSGIYARLETLEKSKGDSIDGEPTVRGSMSDGDVLEIGTNSVKFGDSFIFTAKINTFSGIRLGRGKPSENRYSSEWIDITAGNINVTTYYTSTNTKNFSYEFDLEIANDISVLIHCSIDAKAKITIASQGKFVTQEISWNGCNGSIYAESLGSSFTSATFSWYCSELKRDIWLFGDSYFNLKDKARWTAHLLSYGYDKVLLSGFPGASSSSGLISLENLITFARPKHIVWCLGMNDADKEGKVNASWEKTYNSLVDICASNDIELILSTIPTVKGGYVEDTGNYNMRVHKYKNSIVKNSGYRYIDFEKAVGASEETGEWSEGMLSSDGVHPTQEGAVALFMQALADFPELTGAR